MVFRPGWKLSLFFIVLLPCLLSLGLWQLQRAEEKRQILQRVAERRAELPLAYAELLARAQPAYSQVELRGEFDNQHPVLLDNRLHEGRFGYEVILPFRLAEGPWVLVSRGWTPGSLERDQLPELAHIEGPQVLQGEVYVPLGEAFTLGKEAPPGSWPWRVQALDVDEVSAALGEVFYPYVVRLRQGGDAALMPYWQDINVQPAKHKGYAVQWFVMAAVLVLLYLAVGLGFLTNRRKVVS